MIVCFDIGGTGIKGALVNSLDEIELVPRIKTPGDDYDAFIEALLSVLKRAPQKPDCIAISIAGVIEPKTGLAIVANIPCIHRLPLQEKLEAVFDLPVLIANDADCCALAEAVTGAGRGHRIVFGVILGTGVGGGLVVDGALLNRDGGYAGEWGHGPVAATEAGHPRVSIPQIPCGCGQVGCIDATCGARGMEKIHKYLHEIDLAAEDILADWQKGEARACRTLDVYVDIIASPLALVVNVTGASILPVGGGLSNVPALLDAIDEALRARILVDPGVPLVVRAENRIEPGVVGAAVLGLSACE